jgi:hypothetical protein
MSISFLPTSFIAVVMMLQCVTSAYITSTAVSGLTKDPIQTEGVKKLRDILMDDQLTVMPCCFDGLSARLVEAAGFNLTFMVNQIVIK